MTSLEARRKTTGVSASASQSEGGNAKAVAVVVVLTLVAAYMLISFRIGDVYPFCRYAMFSHMVTSGSRLVAVTEAGTERDIRDFTAWHCGPPTVSPERYPACGEPPHPTYHVQHGRYHIARHAAEPGAGPALALVQQTVAFPEPQGPPQLTGCHLMTCTARPLGSSD